MSNHYARELFVSAVVVMLAESHEEANIHLMLELDDRSSSLPNWVHRPLKSSVVPRNERDQSDYFACSHFTLLES